MVKVDHEAQVGVRKDTPVNTNTESCRITLAEGTNPLGLLKSRQQLEVRTSQTYFIFVGFRGVLITLILAEEVE